jgi:hypothetical protein
MSKKTRLKFIITLLFGAIGYAIVYYKGLTGFFAFSIIALFLYSGMFLGEQYVGKDE